MKALTSALQQYKYVHVLFFIFATTLLESVYLVYLDENWVILDMVNAKINNTSCTVGSKNRGCGISGC